MLDGRINAEELMNAELPELTKLAGAIDGLRMAFQRIGDILHPRGGTDFDPRTGEARAVNVGYTAPQGAEAQVIAELLRERAALLDSAAELLGAMMMRRPIVESLPDLELVFTPKTQVSRVFVGEGSRAGLSMQNSGDRREIEMRAMKADGMALSRAAVSADVRSRAAAASDPASDPSIARRAGRVSE